MQMTGTWNNLAFQETERLLYKQQHIDIYLDHINGWVHANWKGTPSSEAIKEGLDLLLVSIQETGVSSILNDLTLLHGNWSSVKDWIAQDWTPRAKAKGTKAAAFIYSPRTFGQFSIEGLLQQHNDSASVRQKPFKDMTSAITWLSHVA